MALDDRAHVCPSHYPQREFRDQTGLTTKLGIKKVGDINALLVFMVLPS